MHGRETQAMQAFLTAEATRRFGAARAAALGPEIEALARDLADVMAAELPEEAEPAFFFRGDAGQ